MLPVAGWYQSSLGWEYGNVLCDLEGTSKEHQRWMGPYTEWIVLKCEDILKCSYMVTMDLQWFQFWIMTIPSNELECFN